MKSVFKMKTLVIFVVCCIAAVLAEDGVVADRCWDDICKMSDGCRCATFKNPLGVDENTPQLISLTINEAVTQDNYLTYWEPLLFGRVNPDKQPIGATFFVPHEYTDYSSVNELYNNGFEIGVHSITNNLLQSYWRDATEELLQKEFGGQKKILIKFANIDAKDIIGVRTPQLQLAGNLSIKAYKNSGLLYDNSWPTLSTDLLYPYTLDYLSWQQCVIGSECPNESFKGFWILPINDLRGPGNTGCNTLASCGITGTVDEIADWLLTEINNIRKYTRVPLSLIVSSSWFNAVDNSFMGFSKFLDTLATYDDVFLVSQKQVYEWAKDPVLLPEFKTDFTKKNASCTFYSCKLSKPDGEVRYLRSCIRCPDSYPWLDNPDGN